MISRRVLLALGAILPAAGAFSQQPPASGASPIDPLATRFGGPFTLIDHTGKRVNDTDFRGRFMLVYFGFTRCTDTCPVDLAIIAQALDAIGPQAERLAPLFVTVDPAHDTPATMAAYVTALHPRLIGLTGSESEIAAIARAYKVHRRKLTLPHHGAAEYAVDHGSLTYLMDREGRFLTLLPHNSGAPRLAEILNKYLG